MGIRMDQFRGLNKWAQNFVEGEPVLDCTEEVTRVYPDGRRETLAPRLVYKSSVKKERSNELCFGMFETRHPLYKYIFPDGKVYFEKVQARPWSSGPVFFLALQDEKGNWVKKSLWPQKEIDNA